MEGMGVDPAGSLAEDMEGGSYLVSVGWRDPRPPPLRVILGKMEVQPCSPMEDRFNACWGQGERCQRAGASAWSSQTWMDKKEIRGGKKDILEY